MNTPKEAPATQRPNEIRATHLADALFEISSVGETRRTLVRASYVAVLENALDNVARETRDESMTDIESLSQRVAQIRVLADDAAKEVDGYASLLRDARRDVAHWQREAEKKDKTITRLELELSRVVDLVHASEATPLNLAAKLLGEGSPFERTAAPAAAEPECSGSGQFDAMVLVAIDGGKPSFRRTVFPCRGCPKCRASYASASGGAR